VIHADIPKTRTTLLHRSGRTGRAGRKGVCVLIIATNDHRRSERVLDSANITATWARPPSVDEIIERDRERILDDPMLSDPVSSDELPFVQTLLDRHGGEQVAAAFLRLHSAGRSAPEELLNVAAPSRAGRARGSGRHDRPERGERSERPVQREKRREDFTGGVWFSLSVGSRQSAEARWLLPMLCRHGKLTKQAVGAIKVGPDETKVELAPQAVEGFLAAIGPSRTVDGKIVVTALDGGPTENRNGTSGELAASKEPKKTTGPATDAARRERPTSPHKKRKGGGDSARAPFKKRKKSARKPGAKSTPKRSIGPKPTSDRKAAPTTGGGGKPKPGSAPLRRKKTPA